MSQIPRILQAFVWAVLHSQFSDSASLPPGSGTPARSYIHSQPSAPAATSTTSPTSSSSSSSSSSTNIELGAILGSVLGAFVFALCICSCCYFLRSSTKKKVEHDNSGNSSTTSASIASSDLSGLEGETHLRYMSESDVSYSFSGASSPEQQQNVRRSRPPATDDVPLRGQARTWAQTEAETRRQGL
ncbi:hypothetical protein CFIMG_008632RA00001 [Ceratocystis fimbriata CBS 114723]|uniref:Uncharacterized protein n=1 Tax=Ceratocystis fimbriata CBS 114723 TaxID=1035309 RepID=A0A2C5XFR0_9PEZI|nr:hypothetical protein CFIMG_008632RA00001 [Ceratocystis fimbriata CBS 114723]